ncbi:MAG: endonuclease IV [Pseudonocardiales bacterium]|nr:MAG: endonuclease IV [Pseudonocardiales bacterium]
MARAASPIGAHVSAAGGLALVLPRAQAVGAETLQLFVANTRAWAHPKADPAGDEMFRATCPLPVFVHAPYLINFGSPSPDTLARSTLALAFSLRRAAAIGARGVVMHAGSAVLGSRWGEAVRQVREHVLPLIGDADGPLLLIEPTAGGGGSLACDAPSLAAYLDVLGRDERIGVCLDTCHLHAAGHDLTADGGVAAAMDALHAAAPGRLGLIHANDSLDECGSRRDRHQNVGRGTLGRRPFWELLHHPVTAGVAFVVETPGDEAGQAADIARLRRLRSAALAPAGPRGRSRRTGAAIRASQRAVAGPD